MDSAGAGKYVFEIGCEQHGEYIPIEIPDGENAQSNATLLKWKADKITAISDKEA